MLPSKRLKPVEQEVWDVHSDTDSDETVQQSSSKRRKYKRNKKRRKSKTQSCSSLYSFAASITPSTFKDHSEPNVNYYTNEQKEDMVDLNLSLNLTEAGAPTASSATNKVECTASPTVSKEDTTQTNASTPGVQTNGSTADGIRSSVLSMLSKLGKWKKCNCKSTQVPHHRNDCNMAPENKPPSHSSTSTKYFRAFSFSGKSSYLLRNILI